MFEDRQAKYRFWLAWLAITIVYIVIRINIVEMPLDRDEGLFGYTGQQILNGGIPYRDSFDHKPPVAHYIDAFALLFFPPTSTGIHLFLHLYNYLTLICVYLVAKRYTDSTATGLWAAFAYAVFSSSQAIQGFTASTEMFMLLPITLSLLFAVSASKAGSPAALVLSGVTGALACWTKQTAFLSILFVVLYLVTRQVAANRQNARKLYEKLPTILLQWLAGAVAVSLIIVGYFYGKGVFDDFVYWAFTHNVIYSSTADTAGKVTWYLAAIKDIFRENFLLLTVGIGGCLFAALKQRKEGLFFLLFLVFSILGTIPGFAYPHYFAQLAPAVALAAGFSIASLTAAISGRFNVIACVLIAALVVGIPFTVSADYYYRKSPQSNSRALFGYNPFPESRELARYIKEKTTPNDYVYIFGSEAQILLSAERKSPTPYAMMYLLSHKTPRQKEFQQKAWQDLLQHPPKYILYVDILTSTLWNKTGEQSFMLNTLDLIKNAYYPEAVMMVTGNGGEMIKPESVTREQMKAPKIIIYRRKAV